MNGVASLRSFQTWITLVWFWSMMMVLGDLGLGRPLSALEERLARVTREVCERNGGTVVRASNRSLRCMSCASPTPMGGWP